jgi:hypothetical protein
MSAWPPRYEDNFIIRETGVPPYYKTVRTELARRGALFLAMSAREQSETAEALYIVDMTASLAARELRNSPWSAASLFKPEPPNDANPVAGKKQKQKYEQWLRYREHQWCLRFCERARRALLRGEWGKAIHAALYAGNHLNGALAMSARQLLPDLHQGRESVKLRAEQHREIILREAAEFRAKSKTYNIKSIATRISEKHSSDPKFPGYESIRRTLGQIRVWENSLISQQSH